MLVEVVCVVGCELGVEIGVECVVVCVLVELFDWYVCVMMYVL